uniref:sucrose synthase n=1 Tax=Zea mays TaxID=4577 RepID=A0A804PR48_MAIZE
MGITHCNIAHALEKTKYPDSDIFWKNFDEKYHFSCQFTTDIIAMNNADFIITSTYQEIAGRFLFCFRLVGHCRFLLGLSIHQLICMHTESCLPRSCIYCSDVKLLY